MDFQIAQSGVYLSSSIAYICNVFVFPWHNLFIYSVYQSTA